MAKIEPGVYDGPLRCPIDKDSADSFLAIIQRRYFDEQGYQRAKRLHGLVECPKCNIFWPLMEDIEEWQQKDGDPRWWATGWGLCYAFCDCGLAFAGDFEGVMVLDLRD